MDALICLRRRHPNVSDDNVWGLCGHSGYQLWKIPSDRHDFEVILKGQYSGDPLPHEDAVFGHHHPECHGEGV